MRRRLAVGAVLLSAVAALTACDDKPSDPSAGRTPTPTSTAASGVPTASATVALDTTGEQPDDANDPNDPAYEAAVSTPVEDSVYPDVGDPSVDALHYGLDLAWTPSTHTLTGVATIVFRAPLDEDHLQLDLAAPLEVSAVLLDGQKQPFQHPGKDLVVQAAVTKDSRHVLEVRYAGQPKPTAAPTTRSDVATVGWTNTADGGAWTMQEPFGAYTWYPVNDQPADKAFYDISITTAAPFVGIANGTQTSSETHGDLTTTSWRLDAPASSYLVTVAVGDYQQTDNTAPQSGTPITYWVPKGSTQTRALHDAAGALDWVVAKLGPYPFKTLGFVLVDSTSGMETQTLITLGDNRFDVAMPVLVHELVHQWYGDEVTPSDWSDLWMNEGMAMYLQFVWQAEQDGKTMAEELAPVIPRERQLRAEDGPPAAYDPSKFAESNVYYGPALMYQALRQRIGDRRFFAAIKAWPATHPDSSQSRDTFVPWLVQRTGVPRSFFDTWLLSPTSPDLVVTG